ncbi:MAG TPA: sigma-70 family RNA polymerase sigma factor [Phycisphaerales bacterium]|nr:sigma-70 family RNA polymerase sigma factor [Phycisphaerales bacterium]
MAGPDGAQHWADGDERELVRAAMRGEHDAIRLVWARYRRWVAALLLAYKPRQTDVEDLLQDVAMTFVRRVSELREPESLRPWLRSVAINAARLAGRKQTVARRHGERLRLVVQQEGESQPDVAAAQREAARRLLDLAMGLPEGYREPLLLRCMQGMSYREIGAIVGLPESTIETRIARGRRMLREMAAAQEAAARSAAQSAPIVEDAGVVKGAGDDRH